MPGCGCLARSLQISSPVLVFPAILAVVMNRTEVRFVNITMPFASIAGLWWAWS